MSEPTDSLPDARPQPRRWFSWIWLLPLLAAGVVVWLAIRSMADRGPLISISFSSAEGLQAGDTKIKHRNVDLGTVESIALTPDMARVVVRARMRRAVGDHLTANTRFWVVRPRVGIEGISGLSTLVSGSYIEMYPGMQAGAEQDRFVGLDSPPVLTPDTPGRSFTLYTTSLGSLVGGSPISYRGLPAGEVEGYALDDSGKQIKIFAFVREPYDRFVNPQSRFWNSGGIDVAVGVQGVRFRASSWQQLISGGISFDTPDQALTQTPSTAETEFPLYDSLADSLREPRGPTLVYRVDFLGGGDVAAGTDVQMMGSDVGEVTEARLQYDDARSAIVTRVTLEIDPSRIEITHRRGAASADAVGELRRRIESLVARGLRARMNSANFITGGKVVSLDLVPDAPKAGITELDGIAQLPTASATDLMQLLSSVQSVLHHIDSAAGPELGHAVKELDRTLTNLDQLSGELEPQLKPLLASLRATADSAQRTLQAANGVLGTSAASGADLPRLLRELTEAARSLRDLTDYLERHPESLIRGRKVDTP